MGKMQEIEAELAALKEREGVLYKRWKSLKDKDFTGRMNKLFPDGEITIARIMAIDWHEYGNLTYNTPWGKKISAWLQTETAHGSLCGLYPGGESDTNQAGFQILIRPKPRWQRQVGFLMVLPHMKPNAAGAKVMSLFGSTWGTIVKVTDNDTRFIVTNRDTERRLAQDPNDKWSKPIAEFGTGRELLSYLHANYAYKSEG